MESILQKVGLSTLSERFADEKIDPHVILAMSDSSLMRLGVETLGDRVRLKENCKQFADGERRTNVASTSSVGSSQAQQLIEERRRLFQPYSSRREKGSGTSKSAKRKNPSRRTWTGQFVCLADRQACRVPSSSEKQILQQAGLGLKKIKFFVDENEEEVVEKLTSDMPGDDGHPIGFPQLKEGKGFEIMSCVTNSRDLAVIKSSWSVEGLKSLFTPQTKIYLRPIQKSLRVKGGQENRLTCKLKEKCMWCSKEIPLNELRSHLVTCNCNVFDDNIEDEVMVLSDESRNDLKDYIANALSSATVSTKEVESLSIGQGGSVYPSPSVPLVASDTDSSPMLTFPSSCGNANQAEAGPSSSQGTSTISETHFTGNQTESSDSSPMLTFPSSSGNGNQAEAGPSSSQGISTISETHFIGNQTESSDSSPMLTFPSSSGNGNQAEAGPSSSQGISTISETHFIGNQTESSDSSPMLTFPSSSGNGNQAEAGPSSSQGISTISETHFIGSQTESTAHPLEGTSLGPLTNNDHITMEKFDVDIALIMPKIKEHIYSTGWIHLYYFDHVVSIYCKTQKI